jgi:hypothetical protein
VAHVHTYSRLFLFPCDTRFGSFFRNVHSNTP